MDDTNFVDFEGHITKSNMQDEHEIIKIIEKKPTVSDIGKIVSGDSNSNILTFEINRYYDGVDLLNKIIKIIVKTESGIFTEDAVDIKYNDTLLRFSWILSSSVTHKSGTVNAAIIFIGTETSSNYALKSLPFSITIENSLDFSNTEPPYMDWYIDIENELFELKKMILDSNISGIELHEHLNKNVLDKLSLSDDGNLLYDGKEIVNSQQPLSAYDVAVSNGYNGSESEWLDSLKGQQGDKGIDGKDGVSPTAFDVATQLKSDTEFVNSLKGEKGDKGDPGQDCSIVITSSEVVTELKKDAEFLEAVKGEKGDKGDKGDSADGINLEVLDSIESVHNNTTSGKLVDGLVIKEVFQSVSNGKELIASAITDKGVQTDANVTFSKMAENIGLIENYNETFDSVEVKQINDFSMTLSESIPKILTALTDIYAGDVTSHSCTKLDITVTEG